MLAYLLYFERGTPIGWALLADADSEDSGYSIIMHMQACFKFMMQYNATNVVSYVHISCVWIGLHVATKGTHSGRISHMSVTSFLQQHCIYLATKAGDLRYIVLHVLLNIPVDSLLYVTKL